MHTCNPNTGETDTGGSEFKTKPELNNEFKSSQEYLETASITYLKRVSLYLTCIHASMHLSSGERER